MPISELAFLAGLLLCAGPIQAKQVGTGFLDRTLVLEGQTYRYQVYIPADYPAQSSWPVILFLHGAGERGRDGLIQTTVGLGPALRRNPGRFPAIIVFPQARPDSQWVGVQADMALAALAKTLGEFHGDHDRVYLTGLSMGGHGAWFLAYQNPTLFAAVAPICGWTRALPEQGFSAPVAPTGNEDPLASLARRLARMPIWIFHGEMDSVVPVQGSREPAER